ncbi:MAG: TMEM14 family protein [Planctomycetes bacterium]|nr:TMEM14 family protein [Planctomycetota bacterium]
MTDFAAAVTLVYGALVFLGGIVGYLKAKSKASLVSGGIFGLALAADGIAGLVGWSYFPRVGAILAAVLLAFFGFRYARKKKIMPAGFLAALSLAALLVDVLALLV